MNPETLSSPWIRRLTGPLAAAVILAAFWLFMLASLWNKSLTFDEIGHAAAGYSYWHFNDYRLDPENGNLPQRIIGLPLAWGHFRFPAIADSDAWHRSDYYPLADEWFNRMGNDVSAMLIRGRAASGLMAVALGALVWAWARRLYGPGGGMLSLALFVLSPTVLANGALMTSDTASALFFLAATMGWWAVLHRLSAARVLLSGLATGALFVSKTSAVLILPIALVLLAARLMEGGPLPLGAGRGRELLGRGRQAAAFAAAILAHAAIAVAVIWAGFGFRYSAFAHPQPGRDRLFETWEDRMGQPPPSALLLELGLSRAQQAEIGRLLSARSLSAGNWSWDLLNFLPVVERTVLTPAQARQFDAAMAAPPAKPIPRLFDWIRREHLLPEAYIFGQVNVLKTAQKRGAFLNGNFSLFGWRSFFPYTVLVKTPLTVFGVILLAIAATLAKWRSERSREGTPIARQVLRSFYAMLPLWTLLGVYWAVVISSHINIGHRHVLVTYPPMFILAGAAAAWPRRRPMGAALLALMALLAAEVCYRFPDYLAYFNPIAGGPAHAYRHLVDSSLDWGQDLPGVGRYIESHRLTGPIYLSYFGTASPEYYHIPARMLYSYTYSLLHPMQTPMQEMTASPKEVDAVAARMLKRYPDYEVATAVMTGDQEAALFFLRRPEAFRLAAGTYFISATMLQALEYDLASGGPWGPWNDRYEARYQLLYRLARPFLENDNAARVAALQKASPFRWMQVLYQFDQFRLARLTACLRQREPDASIGYSILVYRLSAADLARALDGPSPEHGLDEVQVIESQFGGGNP